MKRKLNEIGKRLMQFEKFSDYVKYWNNFVIKDVESLAEDGLISDEEINEFIKNYLFDKEEYEALNKIRMKRPLLFSVKMVYYQEEKEKVLLKEI